MPGTLVTDAHADSVLIGTAPSTAATTTTTGQSTAKDVIHPRWVQVEVVITNTGGTSPTLDITLEGASDSGFTTDVVQLGAFGQITADGTVQLVTYVDSRYFRLNYVIAGTSPTFDILARAVEPHYLRTPNDGANTIPDSDK